MKIVNLYHMVSKYLIKLIKQNHKKILGIVSNIGKKEKHRQMIWKLMYTKK